MSASRHAQRNLPPMEVRKPEDGAPVFRKSEDDAAAFRKTEDDGYALASALFDAAMGDLERRDRGALTNKDVAFLCGVSESLVQKWRSPDQRACPSFAQLLVLPPAFHIALHRAMNQRFGFGRAALARLLDVACDLALVVD